MSDSDENLFDEEEMAKLTQDRKRYLSTAYITTGIKPVSKSSKKKSTPAADAAKQKAIVTDSNAAAEHIAKHPEAVCNADHGLISWATAIHSRSHEGHAVPIKEDSGTEVNWIAPEMVGLLACEVYRTNEPTIFQNFHGHEHDATHYVSITLKGRQLKTQHLQCFVAPEGFPLSGVVVGSRFMHEQGPAQNLFLDKPQDGAYILVTAEKKEAEQLQTEMMRAEAQRAAAALEARRLAQQDSTAPTSRASNHSTVTKPSSSTGPSVQSAPQTARK